MNESFLEFSTSVLGEEAAQRLKDYKVTQTIRSRKSAAPFFQKRGSIVTVRLDGKIVFDARITEVKRSEWRELSQFDAEIGGFNGMEDLEKAAKRAGFRFKNLNEYEFFRIQFQPIRPDGDSMADRGVMFVGGIEMAISEMAAKRRAQEANVPEELKEKEESLEIPSDLSRIYYHNTGEEDEFSDCVCPECNHVSVAECKAALCECCEMDDESKKRYAEMLARIRNPSAVNPITMEKKMTCPVCGSPDCDAVSGGYSCKRCGTTARRPSP